MSVLGVDMGTSGCKAIVLAADGRVLNQCGQSYAGKIRLDGDCAEIPAEVFAEGLFGMIRRMADSVKTTDPIRAIALSTHGETLIPVDASGRALCSAILSMDRRSAGELPRLEREIGAEQFYRITGTPLHSQYPASKILWLKRERPELVRKTARYCTVQDYLHGRLGAAGAVDASLASRFGMLDIKKRAWSEEILNAVGAGNAQLPQTVCAGTVLGAIPHALAESLGLEDGVSVVAGGHDQPCASLALGAQRGRITVSAGSYECAAVTTDRPLNDAKGRRYGLNSYCHVLKDQYITLAFFASGLTIQWVIDRFCRWESAEAERRGMDVHELLEEMSADRPTGICVSPYFYGSMNPEWNERARAAIVGLSAADGVGEVYRAALEGTACELDLNLRVLEKLSGRAAEVVMGGGGTSSRRWMQIRADIANRPLDRDCSGTDASCMGAAMLAGLGIGMFASPEEAFARRRSFMERIQPRNSADYARQKAEYRSFHRAELLSEIDDGGENEA